jgi:hypothetical protein
VASAVNHRNCGVGEQIGHIFCNGSKFVVCGANDQQNWAFYVGEATPQWLLGPGASEPKTCRKACRSISKTICSLCCLLGQSRKEWVGQPLVNECVNADLFDVVSQRIVGNPASASLGVIGKTRRCANQH